MNVDRMRKTLQRSRQRQRRRSVLPATRVFGSPEVTEGVGRDVSGWLDEVVSPADARGPLYLSGGWLSEAGGFTLTVSRTPTPGAVRWTPAELSDPSANVEA